MARYLTVTLTSWNTPGSTVGRKWLNVLYVTNSSHNMDILKYTCRSCICQVTKLHSVAHFMLPTPPASFFLFLFFLLLALISAPCSIFEKKSRAGLLCSKQFSQYEYRNVHGQVIHNVRGSCYLQSDQSYSVRLKPWNSIWKKVMKYCNLVLAESEEFLKF